MKLRREDLATLLNVDHAMTKLATFKDVKAEAVINLAVAIQRFSQLTKEVVKLFEANQSCKAMDILPELPPAPAAPPLPPNVTPMGKKKK